MLNNIKNLFLSSIKDFIKISSFPIFLILGIIEYILRWCVALVLWLLFLSVFIFRVFPIIGYLFFKLIEKLSDKYVRYALSSSLNNPIIKTADIKSLTNIINNKYDSDIKNISSFHKEWFFYVSQYGELDYDPIFLATARLTKLLVSPNYSFRALFK